MTALRETFLSQFEDRWRPAILEFAKRISDSDADVLVFMARKAACLYHCLEDLGLSRTHAICTSDLALEEPLDWIAGKRVELIDDTLITGTTLYSAASKVRKAGCSHLRITTFCVDKENWCKDLVAPEPPYLLLEPHDVTSFSAQAVRAIGVLPRPYSVDFPLFGGIRLPGAKLDNVLSSTAWELDDVSTETQVETGASAMSMVPPIHVLHALNRVVGWPLSDQAQLFKVRLYSRSRSGPHPVHLCRAVPFVAFDPMLHTQLEHLWRALEKGIGEPVAQAGSHLRTFKGRLRFLQCFCAAQLFSVWLSDIRGASGRRVTAQLDNRQMDFAFPPLARPYITEAMSSTANLPMARAPRFSRRAEPKRIQALRPSKFKGVDLPGVQARLTEPFLELFQTKELVARQLVQQHGRNAFRLDSYRHLIDRLSHGISLPELRALVGHPSSARTLVSMFLDEAVDRGIAVPITVDDGTCVYRAYRHGEDVKFTEVEARLACILLQEAGRVLGLKELPRLVVEKLIVLLIRGGLSLRIIERWAGTLGDRRAVGVRYYLHGAVAQLSPDRRPYHYSPGDSLTSLLKGWGYLVERKKGEGGYRVNELPSRPPTTTATEKEAKALGAVIGMALKGIPAKDRDEELTLIASCIGPVEATSAMAAEVHFFERYWIALSRSLFAHGYDDRGSERTLRLHEIYEAVNSGLWKWKSFLSGEPRKALTEWHRRVESADGSPLADALLEAAFPVREMTVSSPALDELISTIGRWLVDVNIGLRLLRVAFLQSSELGADKRLVEQLTRQARGLAATRDQPRRSNGNEQLVLPFDSPLPMKNPSAMECRGALDVLAATANVILDQVDVLVTPFGRPRDMRTYRHLLTVHLQQREDGQDEIADRTAGLVGRMVAETRMKSTGADLVFLPHAPELWKAHFAIGANGSFSRAALARLAGTILSSVDPEGCRCILWTELEPDERIFRAENTSDVSGRNLQDRITTFVEMLPRVARRQEVFAVTSRGLDIAQASLDEVSKHAELRYDEGRDTLVTAPIPRSYSVQKATRLASKSSRAEHEMVDIGVITIVTEETFAAKAMLKDAGAYSRDRHEGAFFYRGALPANDGQSNSVVATQALEQGNRSVIMAYERLCGYCRPRVVVLLGIGGSIKPKIRIGDVVIADRAIWYEQATIVENDAVDYKGEGSKITANLRVLVNEFLSERGAPCLLTTGTSNGDRAPTVHFGPIGTGEKVVRFRNASVRKWLEGFNYQTMALETEAGGVGQAFYEGGLSQKYQPSGYLVIRGISDHADVKKNDRHRMVASINACATLRELLAAGPTIRTYFPTT